MCVNKVRDSLLKLSDAPEDATFQLFSRELCKEALYYVEPGTACRYEMKVESLVPLKPGLDLGMFVCGVVVDDQMNVQFRGSFPVYEVEELDPFLVAVIIHTARNHFSFEHIDSGEEGCRAVTLVIVCHGSATAFLDRQLRLCTVQGLNRGLLTPAQPPAHRQRIPRPRDGDVVREMGFSEDIVNINGGAIALGHPLGCTGAKLTATLLHEMTRRNVKYGLVTMCIGGGMGGAGNFELCE